MVSWHQQKGSTFRAQRIYQENNMLCTTQSSPPKNGWWKALLILSLLKKCRRVWNLYHFGANKNQLEIQQLFFFKQILVRGKVNASAPVPRPPGRLKHLDQAPSKQAWHFWDVEELIQFGLSPLLGCNRHHQDYSVFRRGSRAKPSFRNCCWVGG